VTAVAFSPNGDVCMGGGSNGRVETYNTQTFEHVGSLDVKSSRGKNSKGQKVTAISFCENSQLMLVTTNDSRLRLYHIHSNFSFTLVCKYMGLQNNHSHIKASLSPLGLYIVCASEDQRVYVWNREIYNHMPHFIYHNHRSPTSDAFECFVASEAVVNVAIMPPIQPTQTTKAPQLSLPLPSPPPPSSVTESMVNRYFFIADMNGFIRVIVNEGLPRPFK